MNGNRRRPGSFGAVKYGRFPATTPPGDYSERHVFNEGARALAVDTPWRKMAQYAFTGAAAPILALPANNNRCYLIVQNNSLATPLWVGFGAGADATNGIQILFGGGNFLADYMPPTDDIYIWFTGGAAERCTICEGVFQPPPEF